MSTNQENKEGDNIGRDKNIYNFNYLPFIVPLQSPPLSAHYIPRSLIENEIIDTILNNATEYGGVLTATALHGIGGSGKTSIAAAITHSLIIRNHFTDGILWATLGQNPDCLSYMNTWIHALGDNSYHPTNEDAASSYLRTLLSSRRMLLIVDDVWDSEHIKHFIAGGSNCHLLITTRRLNVLDALGGRIFQVDQMSKAEATELLKKRVQIGRGKPVFEKELEQLERLAETVGYLPLGLELMGAMVARGYSWESVIHSLKVELTNKNITNASNAYAKLYASLRVSLNRLRNDDPSAWKYFIWLGVLASDVILNSKIAKTLWGKFEEEAIQILNLLADESIIKRTLSGFSIHSLMHEMAEYYLVSPQPEGLNINLLSSHGILLGKYASQINGKLWSQLQDDNYIYSHLFWHFKQSGDMEAPYQLLCLTSSDEQNSWYKAKDLLNKSAGFIDDVRYAWHIDLAQDNSRLSRQCRYALMIASIHSLAQTIPTSVLLALVKRNIWAPEKVFDHVRRIININKRADSLLALLSFVEDQNSNPDNDNNFLNILIGESKRSANQCNDNFIKAQILAKLSKYLTEIDQKNTINEAINLVSDSIDKLKHLAKIAPEKFRDEILENACNKCNNIENLFERIITLSSLTAELSTGKNGKYLDLIRHWTEMLVKYDYNKPVKKYSDLTYKTKKDDTYESSTYGLSSSFMPNNFSNDDTSKEINSQIESIIARILENKIQIPNDLINMLISATSKQEAIDMITDRLHVYLKFKKTENTDENKLVELLNEDKSINNEDIIKLIFSIQSSKEKYSKQLLLQKHWLNDYAYRYEEHGRIFTMLAEFIQQDTRKYLANKFINDGIDSVGAKCVLATLETESVSAKLYESAILQMASLNDSYSRQAAIFSIINICPLFVVQKAIIAFQRINDAKEQAGTVFTLLPYLNKELAPHLLSFWSNEDTNGKQIATLTKIVAQLSNAIKGNTLKELIKEAVQFSSEWWIVEALNLLTLQLYDKNQIKEVLNSVNLITLFDLRVKIIGRISLRLAKIGYLNESIDALLNILPLIERWRTMADVSIDLANVGLLEESMKIADLIESSEEQSKSRTTIISQLLTHGRIDEAHLMTSRLQMKPWRNLAQSWIELQKKEISTGEISRNVKETSIEEQDPNNFEGISIAANYIINNIVNLSLLHEVVSAACDKDIDTVTRLAFIFWKTKIMEGKTCLEIIAEKTRSSLLKEIQILWPFLSLSFNDGDTEELVSAIYDVSLWWR